MEEEKAKFDREMLLKGKSLSEEEFQRLLQQHQSNMKGLEGNFDKEKDRQKKSLADKVNIILSSSYLVMKL